MAAAYRHFSLSEARGTRVPEAAMKMMNLKKKLANPFALVAQGFLFGAILFWSTVPDESVAAPVQTVEASAAAGASNI